MKVIHTSDWHIGRSLYGRKRYEESEAFLAWLAELMEQEKVDVLLVAGDIFDNSAPSNRAQELYYRFLRRVAGVAGRQVVIIGGNHDSPSFLNAPQELLRHLNIHVVGCASETPADEVLVLSDREGEPGLIVCAVPYLRDRDIRTVEAGESLEDKERKLIAGIRLHYREVLDLAEQTRAALDRPVPMVAMGHLFAAEGRTVDGDGVRELYVGSLAHVGADLFPPNIDYLALGHLHVPQLVGGAERARYSGSPLPMGFGEADQGKSVLMVDFSVAPGLVTAISVPRFQKLERLRGDWQQLERRLRELACGGSKAWLEIVYDGDEIIGNLRDRLEEVIAGTGLVISRVKDERKLASVLSSMGGQETLEDLDLYEVFQRCLDRHDVPEAQRGELLSTYQEAVASLYEEDRRAG